MSIRETVMVWGGSDRSATEKWPTREQPQEERNKRQDIIHLFIGDHIRADEPLHLRQVGKVRIISGALVKESVEP